MQTRHSLTATIAICGALATGASFAQTTPATPTQPNAVQNTLPTATPQPTRPPASPALPRTSTDGTTPQQAELQRQQQHLHNRVQSTTDQAMHPPAQTPMTPPTQANPATASSSH